MKLLYICYDLGKHSTGFTNQRILIGLLKYGIDCRVISASGFNIEESFSVNINTCKSFPNRPARFFIQLGNILGKDLDNYSWEKRAKKKAKRICKDWMPDIIYARANPPSVFQVGLFISKHIKKPLFLHSGDPIPPTPDWNNNYSYRKKKLKAVIEPFRNATEISLVNKEMINYQQSLLNFDIQNRSFICPNPLIARGNKSTSLYNCKSDNFTCVYLGSFFGSRSPELLLSAFELFNAKYPATELHLVGTDKRTIIPYLKNNKSISSIKIIPKVADINVVLMQANLLIDVDSPYIPQVFTSNKLMDYLPIACPILCVSPFNSATRNLLQECNNSIIFCDHNLTQIVASLESAFLKNIVDFSDRDNIISNLSLDHIAKMLINRFSKYVNE